MMWSEFVIFYTDVSGKQQRYEGAFGICTEH
jgi:hypothetical protein